MIGTQNFCKNLNNKFANSDRKVKFIPHLMVLMANELVSYLVPHQ